MGDGAQQRIAQRHGLAGVLGIGAGVVDRVRQLEDKKIVYGINIGLPSNEPERFLNLRAEYYWNLRDRFVNGDIDIPNDELSQLTIAADYLNIPPLLDLCLAKIASNITGKSADKIREYFHLKDDLTLEEKDQNKLENI